jgi:hypothetical protein
MPKIETHEQLNEAVQEALTLGKLWARSKSRYAKPLSPTRMKRRLRIHTSNPLFGRLIRAAYLSALQVERNLMFREENEDQTINRDEQIHRQLEASLEIKKRFDDPEDDKREFAKFRLEPQKKWFI